MKSHKDKIRETLVVVILLILYYVVYFGILIALLDGILRWLLCIFPILFTIILIYTYNQRIKEIKRNRSCWCRY